MSLILSPTATKLFAGSNPVVKPATKFADGATIKDASGNPVQDTDELTGKKVWKVTLEVIQNGQVLSGKAVTVKIISDSEPTVIPRTEYGFTGEMTATPWVSDGFINYSVTINGDLTTGSGKPSFPAPAPAKD